MPLSELAVRKAQASDKPRKLTDEGGLYLLVQPNGSRLWRFDYKHEGKRKTLAFGRYPEVSLADARGRRMEARELLADGRDPSEARRLEKLKGEVAAANTFGLIADEWIDRQKKSGRSPRTVTRNQGLLKLAPSLRRIPMSKLSPHDVLPILQKIEASGRRESAHKLRGLIGSICRYAIATLRAETDPTYALRGALLPVQANHRAAITDPVQLGALLRAIDDSHGWTTITAALQFLALTAARPGEVRAATWDEIDLEDAVWRIPAERMKMRRAHDVPLTAKAVQVLKSVKRVSGDGEFIFPAIRSVLRPLSENALNARLRALGSGPIK